MDSFYTLQKLKELEAQVASLRNVLETSDAIKNKDTLAQEIIGEHIPLARVNAFRLINQERNYQDKLYDDEEFEDSEWSPAEWLQFIETYLDKAKTDLIGCTTRAAGREQQMDTIRKIAALAVAAMEHNNTPGR